MHYVVGDIISHVAARVGASRASDIDRIRTYTVDALKEVYRRFRWPDRRATADIAMTPSVEVTYTSVKGSLIVTVAGADPSWAGRRFACLSTPSYEIEGVVGDELTLKRPMFEDSVTDGSGVIFLDTIQLPQDVAEIVEQEIRVLATDGGPVTWVLATDYNRRWPWPQSMGIPYAACEGPKAFDADTSRTSRTLRVGPNAADDAYVIRIPYYKHYPEVVDDTDPVLIPEENRDLAVYLAMSAAYSEYPFADTQQAERWEGKYERELDKALRSQKETDTDTVVINQFDEL